MAATWKINTLDRKLIEALQTKVAALEGE